MEKMEREKQAVAREVEEVNRKQEQEQEQEFISCSVGGQEGTIPEGEAGVGGQSGDGELNMQIQ